MKTKTLFNELVKTSIWFLLMALLGSFGASIAHGQKLSIGASLNGIVSGSGLGSSLSPQLAIHTESQLFSAGINFQNRHGNLTGVRGRYEFTFNPKDAQEIFLFYDAAWHSNALLGNFTARQESFLNPEFAEYFTNVRVKTLEQHIGFGMNAYVVGSFKVFGAIGAGYYYTMNCERQNVFQYREKGNFSLMLMAGIKMDIKKR